MMTHAQYTHLVQNYIDMVFRIALNYTKNPADAEDIGQTVFLQLFRAQPEFESEEHVRRWLIRVTVNACKKWARSPWRHTVSFEECAHYAPAADDSQRQVLRCVMELPRKYRLPIYLHYYEGYSTQEIAKLLGIPKGTVCTHLDRGRKLLKLQLQEVE